MPATCTAAPVMVVQELLKGAVSGPAILRAEAAASALRVKVDRSPAVMRHSRYQTPSSGLCQLLKFDDSVSKNLKAFSLGKLGRTRWHREVVAPGASPEVREFILANGALQDAVAAQQQLWLGGCAPAEMDTDDASLGWLANGARPFTQVGSTCVL
jgi:hypothetical protein